MTNIRKKPAAEFKAKVAVEAIRQQKTLNELTAEYGLHATQTNTWKKLALATIPTVFARSRAKGADSSQAEIDELHRQIGQRGAERDWLTKRPLAK